VKNGASSAPVANAKRTSYEKKHFVEDRDSNPSLLTAIPSRFVHRSMMLPWSNFHPPLQRAVLPPKKSIHRREGKQCHLSIRHRVSILAIPVNGGYWSAIPATYKGSGWMPILFMSKNVGGFPSTALLRTHST